MAKKTGLGKGLDALFANNSILEGKQEKEEIIDKDSILKLKIIEVEPNRQQPRKHFDEEALEELAESIKRYGVIQPIIVSKKDKYYEIIAGERRWRASKKAGLEEIPCIIRENSERKNKEIALIENIQREDLNAIEKARGFKELMNNYNLTQQELSEIVGKSRSAIANTIRLLNLDERVMDLIIQGQLQETHARALLAYDNGDDQYTAALNVIKRGQASAEVERQVSPKKHRKPRDPKYDAIISDLESTFQGYFGTKVRLDAGKRSGKIIISYSSNEDLERIMDIVRKG